MSTQANDKVYINTLWFGEKVFDDGGSIIKVTVLSADELIKFVQDHKTEDGKLRFNILKKRTFQEGKSTHYAVLDNWQPTNKTTTAKPMTKLPTKSITKPAPKAAPVTPAEADDHLI